MFYRFSEPSIKEYIDFLNNHFPDTPVLNHTKESFNSEGKLFANNFPKGNVERKIQLPCYPGDTVYYTNKENNTIVSLKVNSIVITEDSTNIVCLKPLFNFLSNKTAERYSFKLEEDFGDILFNNLTFGIAYDCDATLASFDFSCDQKNPNNATAELHVLLDQSLRLPVKFVVQLSDGKNYQAFLFDDISKAEKKFNEIKILFTRDQS